MAINRESFRDFAKSVIRFFMHSDVLPITNKLLDVLDEHLNKEASENNLSEVTKDKHKTHLANIKSFLTSTGQLDMGISDLRIKHLELLKTWLHSKKDIKSFTHVSRHLRLCMAAADHAVRMEYIQFNSLRSMKLKRDKEKSIIYLDSYELVKFENYKSDRIIWQQVKDLFLLQCYTGLSYIDLWLFELVDDFIEVSPGNKIPITWVTCITGRGKTKRRYWAELIPECRDLIQKHEGEMPIICNQVYNKILKKIAKELGINKHVTTHTGRKTFATLKRNSGYSIPAIADMLGNTESVARKSYIERSKELVVSEILRLRSPA